MEALKRTLRSLQKLRGRVPTFLYFGEIRPKNLIVTRKQLLEAPKSEKEVDIILHSPGGRPDDAYRLIRTFREKYDIVNIIVPFWAKSAATLFALGGSRLVLGEFGELGPVDPQIKKDDESDPSGGWVSALNVQSSLSQIEERAKQQVVETFIKLRGLEGNEEITKIGRRQLAEILFEYASKFYSPLLAKIETIELGTMARYLDIGRMYTKRVLKQYTKTDQQQVDKLLDFLVYECPDHGYVVDYHLLKQYLPNLSKANEEPFGDDYAKELENLSVFLMENDVNDMVGFLRNFEGKSKFPVPTPKQKNKKSPNKLKKDGK